MHAVSASFLTNATHVYHRTLSIIIPAFLVWFKIALSVKMLITAQSVKLGPLSLMANV